MHDLLIYFLIEDDNWSLESGSLQCQQLPVPPATLIFYKMIYILFFATLHNQISHLFPPCPTSLLPFLVSAAVIRLVRTLPSLIACSICTSWDVLSFRTKLSLCFFSLNHPKNFMYNCHIIMLEVLWINHLLVKLIYFWDCSLAGFRFYSLFTSNSSGAHVWFVLFCLIYSLTHRFLAEVVKIRS